MRRAPSILAAAVALTGWSAASAEQVTVSGLVAYFEAVPLPEGAVTTIRMLDQDGAAVAISQVEDRRVPPIPFELVYDDAGISTDASYALEAEIALGERTLFRSPEPQPLKAPASSQKVSLVVRFVRD